MRLSNALCVPVFIGISCAMSNGRWMLLDCDGQQIVVNVRAVVNSDKAKVGDIVSLTGRSADKKQGRLLMTSDDRRFLEDQIPNQEEEKVKVEVKEDVKVEEDPQLFVETNQDRDFSPSGSLWRPESKSSSDTVSETVQIDIERQYSNKKSGKSQSPTLRPDPLVPHHLTEKFNKFKQISITEDKKRRNNSLQNQSYDKEVTISAEELRKVKSDLSHLQDILKSLKQAVHSIRLTLSADHLYETVAPTGNESRMSKRHEETDKVEDNSAAQTDGPDVASPVNNLLKKEKRVQKHRDHDSRSAGSNDNDVAQMVPIGSGKTFVPKSIYSQINWTSYTMATRKLLMAVFPRKTLATHSLTGKASPAFINKPAKLSLDPKKVFDIVLTVTKKCQVKESLVRSAITIKCADENKMMRIQKEKNRKSQDQQMKTPLGSTLNLENVSRDLKKNSNLNQTK